MHSKGKGKSKGNGLKIDNDIIKNITHRYQNALHLDYYVEAYMDIAQCWYKSRILDCRLAKGNKLQQREYFFVLIYNCSKDVDYDVTQDKHESSYEYYIHYQPLNRRCDEWLPYNSLRKTKQKIIQVDIKKKNTKRNEEKIYDRYTQHEGMDHTSLQAHLQATKFKTICRVQIGQYKSDTWYYSPYPTYYHNTQCLYICQFCLNFYCLQSELLRHHRECGLFHPPGDQIYRDEEQQVAIFEIDGYRNAIYCQNLALLSKLFLDHKNLQWDMSIFLFYILCEIHHNEYHIAGYFSKPKQSFNNLSCILVLPFYQRKGYGKFLITFSYQLSLLEDKIGTPEKPLSDLGRQTYLSWWSQRLIDYIRAHKHHNFNLQNIIKETAITEEDLQWTIEQIAIVKFANGQPYLCVDEEILQPIYRKAGRPAKQVIKNNIHWVPYKVKWEPQGFL